MTALIEISVMTSRQVRMMDHPFVSSDVVRRAEPAPLSAFVGLGNRAVEICYPPALRREIDALMGGVWPNPPPENVLARLRIEQVVPNRFTLHSHPGSEVEGDLSRAEVLHRVLDMATHGLVAALDTAIVLHAASVARGGRAVVMPGRSGAGKSTLSAWLAERGFDHLSDELVAITGAGSIEAARRPLALPADVWSFVSGFSWLSGRYCLTTESKLLVAPPEHGGTNSPHDRYRCGLLLFPEFCRDGPPGAERINTARAATLLMEANLNGRNFHDHGLSAVLAFARSVPAVRLRYGALHQLDTVLQRFLEQALDAEKGAVSLDAAVAELTATLPVAEPSPSASPSAPIIHAATPKKGPVKLTIGMATYDDYDGAYFTIQALRVYHPQVLEDAEILLVDNNPGGVCASHLKRLDKPIANYRYFPHGSRSGTAVRDTVFQEAAGRFVLCLDSHVFVLPDGIRRLIEYFDGNPETADLLQGPMVDDSLSFVNSHWEPVWRKGMWGIWARDKRAEGIDGEPFEIPMQGLGLFACRRDAWLGFNPAFRGFGGEEGYIHEKFRQAGRKTLCLPFLRWLHRFGRPRGYGYVNRWEDRIHNYVVGFRELGLATDEMEAHFAERLGTEKARSIFAEVREELGRRCCP